MSGWQSIDSAPDNLAILVTNGVDTPCVAKWDSVWKDWQLAWCGEFCANGNLEYIPTFWMPLPEPPVE